MRAAVLATLTCAAFATYAATRIPPPEIEFNGDTLEFAPDVVSSRYSDVRLTISPDGLTALWFSRNRPGGPGGYDIRISHRRSAGWSEPEAVPFNSPSRDFDPAFSGDGRYVYFASDRPGGLGGDDLYRVRFAKGVFGAVESLGNEVNTPKNEWAPMIFRHTLLFASDGHGGAGRMDLFTAAQRRGRFHTVVALPGAINTPADDFDATFMRDGKTIVFSRATNLATDPVALFVASEIEGRYTAGNRLMDEINTPNSDTYAPMLDWSDPDYILFTTRRPADSPRGADLYRVRSRLNGK